MRDRRDPWVYAATSAHHSHPWLLHSLLLLGVDMRLTIAALGFELDLTFGPATTEDDEDPTAALNGGTLASTPVGFTAAWTVPEEVPYQPHCPSWDEPEEQA